jgi:hypothetical protein
MHLFPLRLLHTLCPQSTTAWEYGEDQATTDAEPCFTGTNSVFPPLLSLVLLLHLISFWEPLAGCWAPPTSSTWKWPSDWLEHLPHLLPLFNCLPQVGVWSQGSERRGGGCAPPDPESPSSSSLCPASQFTTRLHGCLFYSSFLPSSGRLVSLLPLS